MRHYKQNITPIPVYDDGIFEIFDIKQEKTTFPKEYIQSRGQSICYKELDYGDKLKYELNSREIDIALKILIPQYKEINTLCVLKIEDKFYKVYNTYHFTNEDGYLQTRLTLENYKNAIVKEVKKDEQK